jgi:hypothetical protein
MALGCGPSSPVPEASSARAALASEIREIRIASADAKREHALLPASTPGIVPLRPTPTTYKSERHHLAFEYPATYQVGRSQLARDAGVPDELLALDIWDPSTNAFAAALLVDSEAYEDFLSAIPESRRSNRIVGERTLVEGLEIPAPHGEGGAWVFIPIQNLGGLLLLVNKDDRANIEPLVLSLAETARRCDQ